MEDSDACGRCGDTPPECRFCSTDSAAHYIESDEVAESHWVVCEEHRGEVPDTAELLHEWTPVGECDECGDVAPLWGLDNLYVAGRYCDSCSDALSKKDIDTDVTAYPVVT